MELTLNPGDQLGLTSVDAYGSQKYAWATTSLGVAKRYAIAMRETFGLSGSLSVDGSTVSVVHVENVNLGNLGTGLFKLGNVYASTGSNATGHLYYDGAAGTTRP